MINRKMRIIKCTFSSIKILVVIIFLLTSLKYNLLSPAPVRKRKYYIIVKSESFCFSIKVSPCLAVTAAELSSMLRKAILSSSQTQLVAGRLSREDQTRRLLASLSTGTLPLDFISSENISLGSRRTSPW